MIKPNKTIAVVCGGYSRESAVSMRSAAMVMQHIDRNRFTPYKVHIAHGRWSAEVSGKEVEVDKNDFSFPGPEGIIRPDGVFIIIHGTPGEDGLLQGYFEMIGMPYTTGNVLNMALTFNKKATTRTLGAMGFRVAKSVVIRKHEPYSASFIAQAVGLPCFVKPNCGGSSIGASRVEEAGELHLALDKALKEDGQAIVEEFISGTEVTCGVIVHNGKPTALPVTEIIPRKKFFDYEAKYEGASDEITPARLPESVTQRVQQAAADNFSRLDCRGMIRVDFIVQQDEPVVVEVNTVPGFSEASIIPVQAGVYGLDKTALISAVIDSCF